MHPFSIIYNVSLKSPTRLPPINKVRFEEKPRNPNTNLILLIC